MKTFITFILLLIASPVMAVNPLLVFSGTGRGYDSTKDPNCMGAWPMVSDTDEADISGQGQTLTVSGGDTIPTSEIVPPDFKGTSRDFEHDDADFLSRAESDGNGFDISGVNQPISMCVWFTVESLGFNRLFMSKWSPGQRQYLIRYDTNDSAIVFRLSPDGSAEAIAIGGTNIIDNDFHHACGVYDDTDIRVYLDGVLDSNGDDNPKVYSGGIFNGNADFGFGELAGQADGLMDQGIIFNRALTATKILAIYTDGMEGVKGGND